MTRAEEDQSREHRIQMEVIVDAYGTEEQALGWYYYLEEKLKFPFRARCVQEMLISPLKIGEEVQVKGMPGEDDCLNEMFVEIELVGRTFGVPLAQLKPVNVGGETQEAIDDWHYWVERGYQL